jgi:CxxC motif-containing protein (DUF1111 family)
MNKWGGNFIKSIIHIYKKGDTIMKRIVTLSALLLLFASCKNESTVPAETTTPPDERLSGGATTVFDETATAFTHAAPNLGGANLAKHELGDDEFEVMFVSTPTSPNRGLGPIFNNPSCDGCHPDDGRGNPPQAGEPFSSMLFRMSIPGPTPEGGPLAVPGFGLQLQDHGVASVQPEAQVLVTYTENTGYFSDGTEYHLRTPRYTLTNSYQPLPPGVMLSPRVGSPVFGLGLLEAVSEQTMLGFADETDANRDGISGRANYVWDAVNRRTAIGKFGWKANTPNLFQQAAAAFNGDIGITTSLFSTESCHGQPQYDGRADEPELNNDTLAAVVMYTRTLGVPARRNVTDSKVLRGQTIFKEANCSGCHIPTMQTGTLDGVPEVSNQTIHPYTDLLLHDMGEGLADGRPDFFATGSEWRTQSLWGIGLTQTVNGHTMFLHDGRARNLIEAIMWHSGEAFRSREYVRTLSAADREALIKFLESL